MSNIGIWQEMKGGYYAQWLNGWQTQVMWCEDTWIWETGRQNIEARGAQDAQGAAQYEAERALPMSAFAAPATARCGVGED